LLNVDGKPVSGASIELWQADNNGCYIHSRGTQRGKERDAKFQGYGKIETDAKGEYRFRTIKPGPLHRAHHSLAHRRETGP